jgi:hypothetical protein
MEVDLGARRKVGLGKAFLDDKCKGLVRVKWTAEQLEASDN